MPAQTIHIEVDDSAALADMAVAAEQLRGLRMAAWSALRDRLRARRDAENAAGAGADCDALVELAPDPGAEAEADVLCSEIEVLGRLNAARRALAKAPDRVPEECEWALRDLRRVGTPWARARVADLDRACYEVLPGRIASGAIDRLRAARDAASGEKDPICWRIAEIRERLDPTRSDRLVRLCREVDAARAAADAQAAVARELERRRPRLPLDCDRALGALGRVRSEWSRGRALEVAIQCYRTLGSRILEDRIRAAKYACPPQVRKVRDGVRRWKVPPSDRLTTLLEQASRICR